MRTDETGHTTARLIHARAPNPNPAFSPAVAKHRWRAHGARVPIHHPSSLTASTWRRGIAGKGGALCCDPWRSEDACIEAAASMHVAINAEHCPCALRLSPPHRPRHFAEV